MGLLNVVVEIVTRWLMLEAHSFCCVDSVQSGSALLIGVMQALRGKLKVAALLFRISRTETCVHSWNYTRAGSLHFGQGVRAVTCGLPRCLCHVWTGSTKRVVAGMTRCMHVCSWFVPVRWMYLDFLDFHGFDLASGGLESVKKCRKSSPSAWTPFFFFGWKRDGTPGETWKRISCRKAVSNGNVINFHFISSAGVNTWTRVAPWEPSIQMQAEKKGDRLHAFWLVSAQNSTYKWKLVPSFCKPHFLSALGVLLRPVPR